MGIDYFECGHAECIKETPAAVLVNAEDVDEDPVWIPKSQVHDDSEVYSEGDAGELIVKLWWAKKEGWL